MAKGYRSKGHRKSSKRSKAAKKGWRTRRRHGVSHRKARTHKRRGHKGVRGRKAAGHKLVRYNRLAAKIGKRAAHAQVYGKR